MRKYEEWFENGVELIDGQIHVLMHFDSADDNKMPNGIVFCAVFRVFKAKVDIYAVLCLLF